MLPVHHVHSEHIDLRGIIRQHRSRQSNRHRLRQHPYVNELISLDIRKTRHDKIIMR
jgi:hypothetical protein